MPSTTLLFCSDPLKHRQPDEAYAAEVEAAQRAGFAYALVDFEALVDERDPDRAIRAVPQQPEPCQALYRGWMLRPEQYTQLYDALAARDLRLLNDPVAYRHTHYLPESYALIEGSTPRTVWLSTGPDVEMDRVMEALRPFGDAPVIVKDYVKSRKHEWAEACYVPSAADRAAVERVVRRFLELQGDDLNEGLVFREFVNFRPLTAHSRSGMPLTKEYRVFVLDGEPLYTVPYWEEGVYDADPPPLDAFREVMRSIRSQFYTMDLAQRMDGEWLIVELGDGQVAGLPDRTDFAAFYTTLAARAEKPSRR